MIFVFVSILHRRKDVIDDIFNNFEGIEEQQILDCIAPIEADIVSEKSLIGLVNANKCLAAEVVGYDEDPENVVGDDEKPEEQNQNFPERYSRFLFYDIFSGHSTICETEFVLIVNES
jgi:hypothetical protein